jgi:hypothetical protein
MAVSKKILCVLLSVIVVGIALSARFLCLPAKAMSLDNSITSQMQSDSPKENPNNITTAEIETQITSDERYILMGQTQMTFLYFRLHQQNSIIQTTEAREDKPILPLRR